MKVALTSGAYQAKSLIADAQKCINLYPEKNPPEAKFPVTHYHTPGILLQDFTTNSVSRGKFRASTGAVFGVYGQKLFLLNADSSGATFGAELGTLVGSRTNLVSMSDNGIVLVIVDGSTNGYVLDLTTLQFATIPGSAQGPFFGADKVDYIDTFFIFNRPGTFFFYATLSNVNFALMSSVFGSVLNGIISTPGTMYTDGTYTGVYLTGGTGAGAVATVTVSGGAVTGIVFPTNADAGQNYVVGDLLSAPSSIIGASGSGFVYEITGVGGGFNPLYIAAKDGSPDWIESLIVMHREIWLVGQRTTEVWYDAGAADFPFQALPGAFMEQGCIAKYSLCAQDLCVYFLSQDRQGQIIFLKGAEYNVHRISTHAIESIWSSYSTVSDAIGFTYQQEGHTFIVLTFPTADATWVYDEATGLWHQRAWMDAQGNLHRIRANDHVYANGISLVGDWQDGSLYELSLDSSYDETTFQTVITVPRIRSFPHMMENSNRVTYVSFIADMAVARENSDASYPGTTDVYPPVLNMRYSDDRGKTYGNYVQQTMGAEGNYLTNIKYWRLGMARDRVFELSWSIPSPTALNGAWIEIEQAET
jgi:hypothetical protein